MNREQVLLTQELIDASESYYNTGVSVMPDIIFDQKVEQLRKMEEESGEVLPGSPTQHVGVKVDSLKVVKHEQLALSLDKVKYKERENLVAWLDDKDGLISWKLDGCFSPDTKILMADRSWKPIEEINPGDMVTSFDEKTNKVSISKVIRKYDNGYKKSSDWMLISFGEHAGLSAKGRRAIKCTKNHMFWTEHGWKEAKQLNVGEGVYLYENCLNVVQKQVALGMALGDGSLYLRSRTDKNKIQLSYPKTNNSSNRGYLNKIETLFSEVGTHYKKHISGYGSEIVELCVKQVDASGTLSNPNNIMRSGLTFTDDVLQQMNPLSLAILYIDDGTRRGSQTDGYKTKNVQPRCAFSTNRHRKEDVERFSKWLNNMGFYNTVLFERKTKTTGDGYRIDVTTEGTKNLFDYIAPYIPLELRSEKLSKSWEKVPLVPWWEETAMGESIVLFPIKSIRERAFCPKQRIQKGMKDRTIHKKAYDLEIENTHTYFAEGAAVHNCTAVLTYDNGQLVSAVTRGNGEEGSDITHNAKFFIGVPRVIDYIGHLIVRGEALMEYAEFERINAEVGGVYENTRNLATATIQMLDANESKKRKINFKAFELVFPEPREELTRNTNFNLSFMGDRLNWLETLGFGVVEKEYVDASDIMDKIEEWKEKLPNLQFPTDGLVISYNDMVYGMGLGNTGHHFRHSIALKWTDETVSTTIREIHWSVGKTGAITPVAIFDPVRLGAGSTVTRASLHNLSIMQNMPVTGMDCSGALAIGSKAEVYLANMIIPQVASFTSMTGKEQDIEIPSVCPVCGHPTEIHNDNSVKTLHCVNDECPARQMGQLMNTFSKDGLFVKGLGESQIEDLMQAGLVTADPLSFYTLEKRVDKDTNCGVNMLRLLDSDGWGPKKWDNLIDAINASRETTLQKFLYSLNIPLLGNDLSKKLAKYWHNDINHFRCFISEVIENGNAGISLGMEELKTIDGVGEEKARNIAEWCYNLGLIPGDDEKLTDLIYELHFPEPSDEASDSSLDGLTFVITGSVHSYNNRDEFKASVEARGGKVAGSVSAKTSYLVNNDVTSTSGKNKKAKELGIEIISEDEFIARFGK